MIEGNVRRTVDEMMHEGRGQTNDEVCSGYKKESSIISKF